MNNIPSLNEINRTANMDPNLLTRHYKLKIMNDFMYMKYQNPKLKQSELANNLNMSSSTIQRYRNDINMQPPYRISPNNVKKRTKKAKIDDIGDLKRPRVKCNLPHCTIFQPKQLIRHKFLKGEFCKSNKT